MVSAGRPSVSPTGSFTAFDGVRLVAVGSLAEVVRAAHAVTDRAVLVFDDATFVQDNPSVTGTAGVLGVPTPPDRPGLGLYRPLTTLGHRLAYAAFGMDPWPFHAINLLLHGFVSALVCAVALRFGASLGAGTLAGMVFAVHPVHAEAVAWVTGRAEVQATLFALLAVVLFARARRK